MGRVKALVFRFWPIILVILLASFLFGNTLFPHPGKIIFGGDIYDAYFYWKNYLGESIRLGILPFWNPYNFSGTPFLSHPNINIFYPANWLFIILPLPWAFAFYFFIHLIIAGATMYFLAREYTDRWGAVAGAIVFAFSGYFAARIYSGHLEYIDTAAWVPLVFGMARRAILSPKKKNIVMAGTAMSLIFFSGNELFLLFTLEIIGLYIIYIFITHISFRNILTISAICILGLGLSAVEFIPRLQFIRLSLRSLGVSYGIASSGSFPLSLFRLFIQPFFYGKADSYSGPWPNLSEYTYYVGIVPIFLIFLLIFISIVGKRVRKIKLLTVNKEVWFYLLVLIPIFIWISLGNSISINLHEWLWRLTPFYKSLRFPVRHLFVVVFASSVVSGMIIGGIKYRVIKVLLIAIMVVNLLYVDKQFIKLRDLPTSTFDQKLIKVLQSDKDLYRLLPDYSVVSTVRRDLDFGAATMYKIQMTSDYNSMVLWKYYHFIDLLNKSPIPSVDYYNVEIPPANPWSPIINFLNVKYILSDSSVDAIGREEVGKFKLVSEGDRYKLYQNLEVSPRFFLVGDAALYPTEEKLENSFIYGEPDLQKSILFAKSDLPDIAQFKLDCINNTFQPVQLVSYLVNRITLKTNADCNTFLSTSEVYYPGWKATIDGKETSVYRSNVTFRALYIPKGSHTIVFYYSPDIYYIGGVISILTILGVIFFLKI